MSLPAKRLTFSSEEFAVVSERSGVPLPPGHRHAAVPEDPTPVMQRLRRAGVMTDDDEARLVPAVAANLALFTVAQVLVRVNVRDAAGGLAASYAVADDAGASLFELPDLGAELSLFASVNLGQELIRAVPPIEQGAVEQNTDPAELAGRLPLALLKDRWDLLTSAEEGDDAKDVALGTPEQRDLARRLHEATTGTLTAWVSGPIPDELPERPERPGEEPGVAAAVGNVVWLRTRRGYLGVEPDPDGTEERPVLVRPVVREDLGLWLAPLLAMVLEGAR